MNNILNYNRRHDNQMKINNSVNWMLTIHCVFIVSAWHVVIDEFGAWRNAMGFHWILIGIDMVSTTTRAPRSHLISRSRTFIVGAAFDCTQVHVIRQCNIDFSLFLFFFVCYLCTRVQVDGKLRIWNERKRISYSIHLCETKYHFSFSSVPGFGFFYFHLFTR